MKSLEELAAMASEKQENEKIKVHQLELSRLSCINRAHKALRSFGVCFKIFSFVEKCREMQPF